MKARIKNQLPNYDDHDIIDPEVDEEVRGRIIELAADWFPTAPQVFVEAIADQYGDFIRVFSGVNPGSDTQEVVEEIEAILKDKIKRYRTKEDAARALAETIHGSARMVYLSSEELAQSIDPMEFGGATTETEFDGMR